MKKWIKDHFSSYKIAGFKSFSFGVIVFPLYIEFHVELYNRHYNIHFMRKARNI